MPNSGQSLRRTDAAQSLQAFYDAVLRSQPRPKFSWKFEKDGTISVKTADKPSEVKLWQATNPDARDFRVETLGPKYQSSPLTDQGGGVYVAKVAEPAKGWTAFFVELTFPSGTQAPYKFTTQVRVVPDTLPAKFVPKGPPAASAAGGS